MTAGVGLPLRAYALSTDGDSTRVYELTPGTDLTIGRADDCGIVVLSPRVSRQHAILRLEGGQVTLRDLGSRNGTRVNDALVQSESRTLVGGEVLSVGPATI